MTTTEAHTRDTFPVVWDDAADGQLCWFFDMSHTPEVMTPLGYDLYFGPFLNGFGWLRPTYQNYYVYDWWPQNAGEEAAQRITLQQLKDAARNFWERIVPEVEAKTAYFLRTDFDALSNDQLLAELRQLPEWRTRCGALHTRALFPYNAGMQRLISVYQELIGQDELAAVRLVQGHGCRSVDAGRALWRLAQLAASVPSVLAVLQDAELAASECVAMLERDAAARPFAEAFSSFLDEYGWRTDLFELAMPAWAEDPTIPLNQLRAYLEMPAYDPEAEQRRQVAERDELIADAMAKLSPADAERLRETIDAARHVVSLQEDHNFYIDQRAAFSPRRLVLAAARRLVLEGELAEPNDVFYLSAAELFDSLSGRLRGIQGIADRTKEEMQYWARVTPPPWIGAPPSAEMEKQSTARPRDGAASELPGASASTGVARGPARVLMSLAESDRLHPGDVLVARTTMPAWTPLFAVASAIVTETGGLLSHAAVVAREYGLPAVLNVTDATSLIRDGQLVEVDGGQGVVRLLE
jgi:pyruvate,water dikinase